MRKPIREWLLAREEKAAPALDAIRQSVVAPERATWLESVAELFRPDLRLWASLAVVWLVLAAAHLELQPKGRPPSATLPRLSDLAALGLTSNETISFLDGRH
jgi:hypothetical protein